MAEPLPSPPPNQRYFRAGEIAELLGVDVRTVRRRIADGTLLSAKVCGARLVAEADLRRLLDPESKHSQPVKVFRNEA